MKGISIRIDKSQEIKETCGTSTLNIDNTYYIEMLQVNNEVVDPNNKFADILPKEMELASTNGYLLQDAGAKNDLLDVKVGYLK